MPLLTTRGVGKRYAGTVALRNVDFTADAGEVHALAGANGAGKSTLMSLISGAQAPSEGEIRIDGALVRFSGPLAAQEAGIATVYQEFSLVPQLSVARNVFLGREPKGPFGLVDHKVLRKRTATLLSRYGFAINPEAEVSTLSVAEQQIVEIVRALSLDARILILDEPTSVLSIAEQDNLFSIIRRLKARGMLILYVSHHLRELLVIADRVTVLRDGEKVATLGTSELNVDRLAQLMIGRSVAYNRKERIAAPRSRDSAFRVSYRAGEAESRLEVSAGEIVGVAGLVGSGRTTFARALAGAAQRTAVVRVEHGGLRLDLSSPREAMRSGIVYITEDRKRDGLFAGLDIIANATAAALPSFGIGPFHNAARERGAASSMLERLKLVAESLGASVSSLSGGNQQKVLIGRALLTDPRLLVCDEPTRGVDVGARVEIYEILRRLAADGAAILVVSSEIEELLALADRIVIMYEFRFVADIAATETDEAKILIAASGGRNP